MVEIVLRMGSHAEKDYVQKTIGSFDGLIVGANLVESTPGATASLLVGISGKKLARPFFIDPMTHVFGSYTEDGKVRRDLDWIKSDQKKGGRKIKGSYTKLAAEYGPMLRDAVKDSRSVGPDAFNSKGDAKKLCQAVVSYQLTRLAREFEQDDAYKEYAGEVPVPEAVFAPYFYVDAGSRTKWLDLNSSLASTTAGLQPGRPVHAVLLLDSETLDDSGLPKRIKAAYSDTGIAAVWLWFSRLDEYTSPRTRLLALRSVIGSVCETGVRVYNMHGAYYSLALSHHGLTGISHGIGYGEQKDVMPVIGRSTPTVRYYLPALHRRVGVQQIQRCFKQLGVVDCEDFYEHVCSCAICRGVLAGNLENFEQFGRLQYSNPNATRQVQTPAAAKRCRYQFLLARTGERKKVPTTSIQDVRQELRDSHTKWRRFPTLATETQHLKEWVAALT